MTDKYKHEDRALIAVDCIIFGFDSDEEVLKILLIKRDFKPSKGKWSLMGGFLKMHETIEEAASRVLYNLTGLKDVYMEQLRVFSEINRDPAERTISVGYYALVNIGEHRDELTKKYSAQWFDLSQRPHLIFDHDQMVDHAIKRLKYRISVQPIGFELLPEKFTMRQVKTLYEAILSEEFDKRNFVKKIQAMEILERLDEKDKNGSKKGSYLFRVKKDKYRKKFGRNYEFNA